MKTTGLTFLALDRCEKGGAQRFKMEVIGAAARDQYLHLRFCQYILYVLIYSQKKSAEEKEELLPPLPPPLRTELDLTSLNKMLPEGECAATSTRRPNT
jgi:hypothetical protein